MRYLNTTEYNHIHTPFNRDITSTIINKYVQLKIICHNSSLAALQNLWFIWIPIVVALLFSGWVPICLFTDFPANHYEVAQYTLDHVVPGDTTTFL